MSPSFKKYRLALPALCGLACGLLIRHFRADKVPPPPSATAAKSATGAVKPAAAADEWTSLLDSYLKLPPPASAQSPDKGPKAEADAFLRMLLRPATADTIREGIAFLNSTDTMRYRAVLPSLFQHWARENPDAALETVEALRDPQSRDMLVWETFRALGATDAREAFTRAGNLPSPMLRGPALHALAQALTPEQMPEILRQSMKDARPPQEMRGASFQKDALKAWLRSDPGAPLKFAAGIDDPDWRGEVLKTVLQAQFDLAREKGEPVKPDTATLLELARDSRNVPGITDQIRDLIGQDDAGMAAILAALPTASDREYLITRAVKDVLYLLGENRAPDFIIRQAAAGLDCLASGATGPGRSAEFQNAFLNAATSGEVPVLTAAAGWLSAHDPARLDELTAQASAKIPFTAAKWLAAMPPSPERDQAITLFAQTHAATDPERAAAWAESITDPARRAAALAAVSRQAGKRTGAGPE